MSLGVREAEVSLQTWTRKRLPKVVKSVWGAFNKSLQDKQVVAWLSPGNNISLTGH